MEKVIVKKILNADLATVWGIIGAVGGVDQWASMITSCRLEAKAGEGLKRICGSEQGQLIEHILKLDNEKKVLQYAITQQPFLPVANIVSTIELRANGNATVVTTTVEYLPNKGVGVEEMEAAFNQIYAASYAGIEDLVSAH